MTVPAAATDSFTKPPCLHCKETALSGDGGTTTTTTTTEKGEGVPPPPPGKGTTTTITKTTEKGVPPPPKKTEDGVQYCLRGHQLKLTDGPIICHKREVINCDGCKEPGFGLPYRCCNTCDFNLHEECFQPPPTLQHPHFPGHTFHFLLQPPTENRRSCDACGKRVLGYVYHCKEGGWYLHPCCRDLPRRIRFSDGPELSLREDTIGDDRGLLVGIKNTKACFRCKNATLQGTEKGVPGWSYVSACGVDRCHVHCMMEMMHPEVRRSLENRRLRNRNSRARNRGESWQEMLSITGLVLGVDPTGFLNDLLFQQ